MLERGHNIEHAKDYANAHKHPWEYPHRGGRTYAMEEAYPVLRRDYPLNEKNVAWWVDEKESPYTEVRRFDWYRGYHVGGRSLLVINQKRYEEGDFIITLVRGKPVRLQLKHVGPNTATLVYNSAETTTSF